MLSRKFLLRLVLAGVALSAALGVFAIFAQSQLAAQLVGSAIVIVIAAAVIVPVTPREAGERIEPIAALYMAYFTIAAVLSLVVVWQGMSAAWLGESIVMWLLVGIPAMVLVIGALRSKKQAKPPLPASEGIAAWGAAATLALSMFLNSSAAGMLGRDAVYALAFILLAAVLVASLAATALRAPGRNRLIGAPDPHPIERRLAWLAIVMVTIASLLSFVVLGNGLRLLGLDWPPAMLFASFAIPIAIWNYFGLAHANLGLVFLRVTATATSFIACLCATYAMWLSPGSVERLSGFALQATAAATVVAIASTLAGLVGMRIARMRAGTADPIVQLEWKCPRCRTAASAAPGEHCCERCGLTTILAFRDDLCPECGYDLRGLPAGSCNCPECGRARQVPPAPVITTA